MTYRTIEPAPPEVYRGPGTGLRGLGCASVLLALPARFAVDEAFRRGGTTAGGIALGVLAVIVAAVYARLNEEPVVTIDAHAIRLTRRRTFLGLHGRERIEWEIPLTQLTEARAVTSRSPATDKQPTRLDFLVLPGARMVWAETLGGNEKPGTAYRALLASLEKRLGEHFIREEQLHPQAKRNAAHEPAEVATEAAVRVETTAEPRRVELRADEDDVLEEAVDAARDERARTSR